MLNLLLIRVLDYIKSMKKTLLFLFLTLQASPYAFSQTILNFNTMCDFCSGSKYSEFDKRIEMFSNLIKIYKPDLIALQEVRTKSQIEEILKEFKDYEFVLTETWLMSYADPTIIFNKNKYKLIDKKNYWLGPNQDGSFSLGWKLALPRQIISVLLEDLETKEKFYFLSSHFDNRVENLTGAAKFVNSLISKLEHPVLFAADTNITTDMKQYKDLIGNNLINAFDVKKELSIVGSYKTEKELCYHRKGKTFPECRVDHVFLSKDSPWVVQSFLLETIKLESGSFPSDHRPIIVKLKKRKKD